MLVNLNNEKHINFQALRIEKPKNRMAISHFQEELTLCLSDAFHKPTKVFKGKSLVDYFESQGIDITLKPVPYGLSQSVKIYGERTISKQGKVLKRKKRAELFETDCMRDLLKFVSDIKSGKIKMP